MKSNIFIPEKIKVGFQNRQDTYTKKLAYIIYYDEKGKLRKEKSWNGWRDKEIQDLDFSPSFFKAPNKGYNETSTPKKILLELVRISGAL
jgi:hypothetical protein